MILWYMLYAGHVKCISMSWIDRYKDTFFLHVRVTKDVLIISFISDQKNDYGQKVVLIETLE